METAELTVTADDGLVLRGQVWSPRPDTAPSAAVLLVHGMAEHSGRYRRFAEALTGAGYEVYGYDQRGHGRTATHAGLPLGHLGETDGWDRLVTDVHAVRQVIERRRPGLPVVLFGHSMGSLVARAYLQRYGAGLAGAMLSGTGGDPGPTRVAGLALARLQSRLLGSARPSGLLDQLTFGTFNKPFRGPQATGFEWLSRDEAEVATYVADPWCGFTCSAQFFADLLAGLRAVHDPACVARVPADLPVAFIAGSQDPVGDFYRGVLSSSEQMRAAGVRDVRAHVNRGARHELRNEVNRDEVTADVLEWLDEVVGRD